MMNNMKKQMTFMAISLAALLGSCTNSNTSSVVDTSVYNYEDSCQNLIFELSLEVPNGTDSVSARIRKALIADFICNAEGTGTQYDDTKVLTPYEGDRDNVQAVVDYYGKTCHDYLLKQAKEDLEERIRYVEEDSTYTEEEKESILEDVPVWYYDLHTRKSVESEAFVVYTTEGYVYYGGAHGGVTGTGGMTFSKATGELMKQFIKPQCTDALQPLFRKGFLQYYAEAGETMTDEELDYRLQIEGTVIPLPQQAPFPNAAGDSLTFTYNQYEVTCYADGMPSFKLAVKDIMPYLTTQAKALLGK